MSTGGYADLVDTLKERAEEENIPDEEVGQWIGEKLQERAEALAEYATDNFSQEGE